jgi:hypothetical protein
MVPRALAGVLARLAALAALAVVIFGGARTTEARLDPYYVLRGQSFAAFKPRILIALDTSGSMTWITTANSECSGGCEYEGSTYNSRIYSARKAINEVVAQTRGVADFALMTFDHLGPPTSSTSVPAKCPNVQIKQGSSWYYVGTRVSPTTTNHSTRFKWIERWDSQYGWSYNNTIRNPWYNSAVSGSGMGTWGMCGTNRPFPYLRWDNLGVGISVPNNDTSTLPNEPLYKAKSTETNFKHPNNYYRKVQWFHRFLGRRVNLNCSDPAQNDIGLKSYGDYGNAVSNNTQVCGHDFYYWPYVDGFPGYSTMDGESTISYDSSGGYRLWLGTNYRLGVDGGTLFAPFYSEAATNALPGVNKDGPLSRDDANNVVEGMTSPMYAGGVDADLGTPIRNLVGDVRVYTTGNFNAGTLAATSSLIQNNDAFSHTNIASYLAFMTLVSPNDLCVPTYMVLITDGEPTDMGSVGSTDWQNGMRFLSLLRRRLGVKSYIVGFTDGISGSTLNQLACAAAGSTGNLTSPCSGSTVGNWDTCRVKGDKNQCAYPTSDPEALKNALVSIIQGAIEGAVPAGPSATVNEFIVNPSDPNDIDPVQSNVTAYTESPSFKGHVVRGACTTGDAFCAAAADPLPTDPKETEAFKMGSACNRGRAWDAGACLQSRPWANRRIYSYTTAKTLYRISDGVGNASATFKSELQAMGLLTPGNETNEANAIARFLLGENWPSSWKLAGLGNSAPVVVRRIPAPNTAVVPSVGIRDAACAGRLLDGATDVPTSLQTFAAQADSTVLADGSFTTHRQYQEAVLVGSETGLMHAFHLDSGNELFALLPRNLLPHVDELAANGPATMGQPGDVAQRKVGISTTINQGFVYDSAAGKWRHLGVFGFGKGGTEYVAMDLSQMGRLSENQPVQILWTTDTVSSTWKTFYDASLGETWSRPVLTYQAPNDSYVSEPKAFLVFGSGYRNSGASTVGRRLIYVDAVTGETQSEAATMDLPVSTAMIDSTANYGLVGDVAVASHCLSRYWGEMQEAYMGDVAGRLYRWDLGSGASGTDFPHAADSGAKWSTMGNVAQPLATFRACTGTGLYACTLSASKGDPFLFSPAVVTKDRIDDITEAGQPIDASSRDQVLIAMASGSPYDDAIDAGKVGSDYHSSLYIMVDDHRATPTAGLASPATSGGTITAPAANAGFMRIPLNYLTRTRTWKYPNGTTASETRKFSRRARPITQPKIRVTGLVDASGEIKPDVEVYYITYYVYEPGEQTCNTSWYDATNDEWVFDQGSSYEITFRLGVSSNSDFNLTNGGGVLGGYTFGDGFGTGSGLQASVKQVTSGECADGNCGPQLEAKANKPCAPSGGAPPGAAPVSIPSSWSELDGFSPLER